MLKVTNAGFGYGNRPLLFSKVSFEVKAGETLAILGPNGIGKTTLLRCVMRFLALKEGEIEIDGAGAKHMNQKRFWRDISYVPQAKKLVFGYPAVDMVVMGLSQNISIGRTPRREDYDRAYALLEKFGLGSIANQSCNTLSGGQLQMVLIARALIKGPGLLIMDEPESNLDMKNQLIVLNTIERLAASNLAVVINTHYPEHALRCAHKTLLMGKEGYLFGDTREVITEDHIREYFEIDSQIKQIEKKGRRYDSIIPIDVL